MILLPIFRLRGGCGVFSNLDVFGSEVVYRHAILGVVSLIGMVIRNSVILIDQIDTEIAAGQHPWDAVIVATEHRLRPILLTAAAAILGMIPIAPTVFWGPMAYAVMGGLVVATLLTFVFLPALYVTWFRVKPSSAPRGRYQLAFLPLLIAEN